MPSPFRYSTTPFTSSTSALAPSKPDPSFLCTICWQYQYGSSKPKILGTSAWIVCKPCWEAVLDLSICWVCGECIVRGDEVVSLGWCFWHSECFGCLVCGTSMSVVKMKGEVIGVGVELEDVPLCVVCQIETAGEEKGVIMEKGLETVSRFDRGLSRDRLGMLERASMTPPKQYKRRLLGRTRSSEDRWIAERRVAKSRSGSGSPKKSRGAVRSSECRWDSAREAHSAYLNEAMKLKDLYSLIEHAADLGISEDRTADPSGSPNEPTSPELRALPSEEEHRDIYVFVFDPFAKDAAFKPSKTKPLPKWMKLLPNNVHMERERKALHISAELSQYSDQAEVLRASDRSEGNNSSADKEASTSESTLRPDKRGLSTALPMDIPKAQPRSSITFVSNPRAQRLAGIDHRRSQTGQSNYTTPSEYPSMHPPPFRQKTPFPTTKTSKQKGKARASNISTPVKTNHDTKSATDCCPLADEMEMPSMPSVTPRIEGFVAGEFISPNLLLSTPPCTPSSSEFLERYKPQQSAGAVVSSYTPREPEPILAKIKRQRVGKQNMEQVAGGTRERRDAGGKKIETLGDEEFGLDPRREDLTKELRNLFCEE